MTTKNKEHGSKTMTEKERREAIKKGSKHPHANGGYETQQRRDFENDKESRHSNLKTNIDQCCNEDEMDEE